MRVVVDTNVFVSAALKEKSLPGMAAHIVAESGLLLKSTITERELFVTLAPPASCAADPAALSGLAERAAGGGRTGHDHRPNHCLS